MRQGLTKANSTVDDVYLNSVTRGFGDENDDVLVVPLLGCFIVTISLQRRPKLISDHSDRPADVADI